MVLFPLTKPGIKAGESGSPANWEISQCPKICTIAIEVVDTRCGDLLFSVLVAGLNSKSCQNLVKKVT